MKFWKVFYKGKKDQTVKVDCDGSYTVSAESNDEAQAEAAGMANLDGITDIRIQSCAPLQSTSRTSQTSSTTVPYSPYNATLVVGSGALEDLMNGFLYGAANDYHAYTTQEDNSQDSYVPYTAHVNQAQDCSDQPEATCSDTTQSGYTSYTIHIEKNNK